MSRYQPIREAICHHVIEGKLSDGAAWTFVWMILTSYKGVVWTSAAHMSVERRVSRRTIQSHLRELKKGGYVVSFRQPGSKGRAPFLIDKYETHDGTQAMRLNAHKTKDLDSLIWEPSNPQGNRSGNSSRNPRGNPPRPQFVTEDGTQEVTHKPLETNELQENIFSDPNPRGNGPGNRSGNGRGNTVSTPSTLYTPTTPTNTPPTVPPGGDGKRARSGQRSRRQVYEDEDFQRFWEAYPRKVAKGSAAKAWAQTDPDVESEYIPRPDDVGLILKAIEMFKQSPQWKKDSGEFIPYPATWLRSASWENQDNRVCPECGNVSDSIDGWGGDGLCGPCSWATIPHGQVHPESGWRWDQNREDWIEPSEWEAVN